MGSDLEEDVANIDRILWERFPWLRRGAVSDVEYVGKGSEPARAAASMFGFGGLASTWTDALAMAAEMEAFPPPMGGWDVSWVRPYIGPNDPLGGTVFLRCRGRRALCDYSYYMETRSHVSRARWDGDAWGVLPVAHGRKQRGGHTSIPSFGAALWAASAEAWRLIVRVTADAIPLSLWTDAEGIAESFRFRAMPEGAARRSALLHWVEAHWRKRRQDSAALTAVRRHLRGATQLTSGSMHMRIVPSRTDIAVLGDLGLRFR